MKTLFWLAALACSVYSAYGQNTYKIVGYYPFSNHANDESGYNNHATVHGARLTNDRFGNPNSAYYFDGLNDYIIVNNSNKLNYFPVTFSAWVKPEMRRNEEVRFGNRNTEKQYPNNVISNDNPYHYGHGFGINVWENGAEFVTEFNDGFDQMAFSSGTDKWYFVAVSYNPGSYELYIDGKLTQSKRYGQGAVDGLNHILIGKHNDDFQGWGNKVYFKGIIDEVTIYGAGLNGSQIDDLYKKSAMPLVSSKPITTESVISGQVFNKQTLDPIKTKLVVIGEKSPRQIIATSGDGTYNFKSSINEVSIVSVNEAGYEPLREAITVDKPIVTKNIFLVPNSVTAEPFDEAKRDEPILLKNVLFKLSTAMLLPEAFPELDRLASLMQTKPSIKIRLEGHTDRIGDAANNLKLSQERVMEVKRYLTQKGINQVRITTKGYGDTKTICAPPCEANRRVEFVITEQ